MIRVPPRKERARPSADTVMSMRWPGLAKAGSSAVIITAAALRSDGFTPGGRVRPNRLATPPIACVA
jgi:hypothetical protein